MATAIRDANGELRYGVFMAEDITKRKRAEEKAHRRVAHLEALNAIITAAAAAPDLPGMLEVALDYTLCALGLENGHDLGGRSVRCSGASCGDRPDHGRAGQACRIVDADLTSLQQMIANLVTNACDAMPQGGVLRFQLSR